VLPPHLKFGTAVVEERVTESGRENQGREVPMFKKEATVTQPTVAAPRRLQTVIGDGTRINGELRVDGELRIDGEVEGTICGTGLVVVGKTGVVKADLEAGSAEIAGRVLGKIFARERVVLLGGSRLEGDVQSQSFKIEDGAFFQGNCIMGERNASKRPSLIEPEEAPRIKLADGRDG
jgi:cytoskeletal protein CcmA (bactofilin family)